MDPAALFERFLTLSDGALYALLFGAALLENLLPPLPGDMAVVFGGYLAGLGRLSVALTYAMVTVGSACGFMVYYGLGRWLGRSGVHQWLGRWLGVERLERGEAWVRRRGLYVVLANRALPGLRSVISLVAGFAGLGALPVAALALASSALWSAALVGAGFTLGEEWQRMMRLLTAYERAVLVGLAALALVLAARRWWRRA